jgi:hypothetical protein
MGLSIGFTSESAAFNAGTGWCEDGEGADGTECAADGGTWDANAAGTDYSGFDLAWGKTMSFGDLGVGYNTSTAGDDDAATEMWANWRGNMGFWIFDQAKANFSMTDDNGTSGMDLGFDLFTHVTPSDGVDVLVAFGFGYGTTATDMIGTANNLTWDNNNDGTDDTFSCVGGAGADETACAADGGTWTNNEDGTDDTFSCSDGLGGLEADCDNESPPNPSEQLNVSSVPSSLFVHVPPSAAHAVSSAPAPPTQENVSSVPSLLLSHVRLLAVPIISVAVVP